MAGPQVGAGPRTGGRQAGVQLLRHQAGLLVALLNKHLAQLIPDEVEIPLDNHPPVHEASIDDAADIDRSLEQALQHQGVAGRCQAVKWLLRPKLQVEHRHVRPGDRVRRQVLAQPEEPPVQLQLHTGRQRQHRQRVGLNVGLVGEHRFDPRHDPPQLELPQRPGLRGQQILILILFGHRRCGVILIGPYRASERFDQRHTRRTVAVDQPLRRRQDIGHHLMEPASLAHAEVRYGPGVLDSA